MGKSSHKGPNLEFASLDSHIEETMEIEDQTQVCDVVEVQFQVQ